MRSITEEEREKLKEANKAVIDFTIDVLPLLVGDRGNLREAFTLERLN